MSEKKTIYLKQDEIKYILIGGDSYLCMMVDLTADVEADMLSDANCIDVPFNSQTVTALCEMVREYDIPVIDFVRR